MDDLGASACTMARKVDCFSRSSLDTRNASTVVAVEEARATSISFGLRRNLSASLRIGGAMVAENISVCRLAGSRPMMVSMSGMKPMSSIRSASSITRTVTSIGITEPRSIRSSRRPGVAISTSTPRVRMASCSFMDSPPISKAIERRWLVPYISKFSAICAASSRVGDRISERGIRALA